MSKTPIAVSDQIGSDGRRRRLVELRRPEKLNCLNLEMLDSLLAVVAKSDAEELCLSGAGRAFCTGLDLHEIRQPTGYEGHLKRLIQVYRHCLMSDAHTIALVNGHAAGGGVGLAACAQTVVASAGVRFIVPGGELARLAAVIVPVCQLRTGGKAPSTHGWLGCELDAAQAWQLGLIDAVVSPSEFKQITDALAQGRSFPALARKKPERSALCKALVELEDFIRFGNP